MTPSKTLTRFRARTASAGLQHAPDCACNDHARPAAIAALGTTVRNTSTVPQHTEKPWTPSSEDGWLIDPHTGETKPEKHTRISARSERFALKNHVADLLPNSQTAKCLARRRSDVVRVLHDESHGGAFFDGLVTCSSVWACPVCAAKISERRRAELKGAMDTAKAQGLRVYLVTNTVPHGVGDDLNLLLDRLTLANQLLSSGRTAKDRRLWGRIVGQVRALEVTYGDNGWHPHFHYLVFSECTADISTYLQDEFSRHWQKCCVKAGLPAPHPVHGCKVQDGSYADKYVAKGSGWGLECEMTKAHLKTAKHKHGFSPLDLLRASYYDDDKRARALWISYAEAFKGRRQLHWSTGLKKRLSVVDLSDDEIQLADMEKAKVVYTLNPHQWRVVMKWKIQAKILDYAESDPSKITELIERLSAGNSS